MKKIQMVDLVTQYEEIQEEVDRAVLEVIRSATFINGPDVQAFQEELAEYMGVAHAIPCGNGTDALQLALMALDIKANFGHDDYALIDLERDLAALVARNVDSCDSRHGVGM